VTHRTISAEGARITLKTVAAWTLLLTVPLGASCTTSPAAHHPPPPGASAPRLPSRPVFSQDESSASLWLSFDDAPGRAGAGPFADAGVHGYAGRVESVAGARLTPLAGPAGRGRAVAFPPVCRAETGCGRVMVVVAHAPGLDPGDADFAFGASVMLEPGQTTTGSNIMQKGRFGTVGGQWKLQVDNEDGRPSCVVRGTTDAVTVASPVSIADGRWHRVSCSKDEHGLLIEVDGEGRHKAGTIGTVRNDFDIRLGSSGLEEDDDQFHGALDDVILRLG
jgi:hypothetical protein